MDKCKNDTYLSYFINKTHFSVFDTDGREVDHVNFDITEWKPELT